MRFRKTWEQDSGTDRNIGSGAGKCLTATRGQALPLRVIPETRDYFFFGAAFFSGDKTIVMLRPSSRACVSTRAVSPSCSMTASRIFLPSSGCATSRPRNCNVTFTLCPSARNCCMWRTFVSKSAFPIFGLNFTSFMVIWTVFLRDSFSR